MKKKGLLLGTLLIMVVLLTACSFTKKAITTEEFTKKAGEHQLIVVDAKEQFKDYEPMKEGTIAVSTESWQVEFYVLKDAESATTMYNKNKDDFDKISIRKNSLEENMQNYNKISLDSVDYYMVITRVDNTFLYAKVPIDHKEEAKEFIQELGY